MTVLETVPTEWDDARDVPFFALTVRLFSAQFCAGASVLLAAHDDLVPVAAQAVASRNATSPRM